MSTSEKLQDLKVLLEHLPDTCYTATTPSLSHFSQFFPGETFEPHEDILDLCNGDVVEAVSQELSEVFIEDGNLVLEERGPAVSAIADVLSVYLKKYPEHLILIEWVDRISGLAKKVIEDTNAKVSPLPNPRISLTKLAKIPDLLVNDENHSLEIGSTGALSGAAPRPGVKRKISDQKNVSTMNRYPWYSHLTVSGTEGNQNP